MQEDNALTHKSRIIEDFLETNGVDRIECGSDPVMILNLGLHLPFMGIKMTSVTSLTQLAALT